MASTPLNLTKTTRPKWLDRTVIALLAMAASVAILVTVDIVLSLVFETIQFFRKIPVADFLFGLEWSPQTAVRQDQVAAKGSFGVIPLITGTLVVSTIAMLVAAPLGLASAIYLSEYASNRARGWIKPALEVLVGIPTVVYGFFAALTVAPFIRMTGGQVGVEIASESALAAGIVMGVMIVPLVSSLSDDAINAVPQTLRDAALGLGATPSETTRNVVLPAPHYARCHRRSNRAHWRWGPSRCRRCYIMSCPWRCREWQPERSSAWRRPWANRTVADDRHGRLCR